MARPPTLNGETGEGKMATRPIATKSVTMRFDKAELTWLAGRVAGWEGRVGAGLARKIYGGDWVAGKLTLTQSALHFMPSRLSRMALKQGEQFARAIALAEIANISRRWQMFQHLIDLHLSSGEIVSIRCEGATALTAKIRKAVNAASAKMAGT